MDNQEIEAVARALAEAAGISWQPESARVSQAGDVYECYRERARLAIATLEQCRSLAIDAEQGGEQPDEEPVQDVSRDPSDKSILQAGMDVYYRAQNDRRETLCSIETVKDGYAYIVPYSKPHIGWVKIGMLQALPFRQELDEK